MRNKWLYIWLLMYSVGLKGLAQSDELSINVDYKPVFENFNPLLLTANPAAISYNHLDSISSFSVGHKYSTGDYKATMQAQTSNQLYLHTESYRKLNRTMLYGRFVYSKAWEDEGQFSNNYEAYKNSPYLFVDTATARSYNKEYYQLAGKLSHEFNQYVKLGASVNYNVGLGAQDRDPRAGNKATKLNTKIGAIGDAEAFKIGLDFHYQYRNEDIDIKIIEENSYHNIFALTGLGTYSKHNAQSFYRLYNSHTYGGDFLLEFCDNIIEMGIKNGEELAQDFRREGNATWAAVKTDSRLKSKTITFSDIFTKQAHHAFHQVTVKAEQEKLIGTEILQQLEHSIEGYDVYQWQTLKEEDKYGQTTQKASIAYSYSKYKSEELRDYSLGGNIKYFHQEEEYNFQNLYAQYSNLNYELNASKLFMFGHHSMDTKINLAYQQNLEQDFNLDYQTFITEKIILPDLIYFASDYLTGGITINYAYTTHHRRSYFINTNYNIQHSNNESFNKPNRHFANISVGLIF